MTGTNEKKTRADWLRDPKTNHPMNRPRSTWSEADHNWMEEEAKITAQRIAKSAGMKGSDQANTADLQRRIQAELSKLTPQSGGYNDNADLYDFDNSQNDEEFEQRARRIQAIAQSGILNNGEPA